MVSVKLVQVQGHHIETVGKGFVCVCVTGTFGTEFGLRLKERKYVRNDGEKEETLCVCVYKSVQCLLLVTHWGLHRTFSHVK